MSLISPITSPLATAGLGTASSFLASGVALPKLDVFTSLPAAASTVSHALPQVSGLWSNLPALAPVLPSTPQAFSGTLPVAAFSPVVGLIDPISLSIVAGLGLLGAGAAAYIASPRIRNLVKGMFGVKMNEVEANNPAAVYTAAIDQRVAKYHELKKAVAGIIFLREKVAKDLGEKQAKLTETTSLLATAVESNEDDVALVLITTKDELTAQIASLEQELVKISQQAEEAKDGLVAFQGEIEKLKREMTEMLAKKEMAEARIKIQETLSGLSMDADIKALEGVRESIGKLEAEANTNAEIQGDSLDAKLAKIKAKTQNSAAQSQLDELKRQRAAQAAAANGQVTKTM